MPHRLGRPLRRRARQCSGRPRRPPTKTSNPSQPTRVPPICDAPSRRRSITARNPASNPWFAHSLPSCLVSRRSSTALSPHDWRSSHPPYLRDATAAWPYAKQCTAHLSGADSVPTPPTQRCVLSSTYRLYSPSKWIRQTFIAHSLQASCTSAAIPTPVRPFSRLLRPRPAHRFQYQPAGSRLSSVPMATSRATPCFGPRHKLEATFSVPVSESRLPRAGPLHRLSRRSLGTLIEWNTSEGVFSTL